MSVRGLRDSSRGRSRHRANRSRSTFARNSSSVTCSGSVASRRHLDLHRIVLAQRIAFPVLRHQQPPRIGMAVEHDAEQIPDFALEPVGRRPDAAHRRHVRVVAVQPHLQPQARRDVRSRRGGRRARSAARAARNRRRSARRAGRSAAPDDRAAPARPPADRRATRRSSSADRRRARLRTAAPGTASCSNATSAVDVHYASFCCAIFRWSWTMP